LCYGGQPILRWSYIDRNISRRLPRRAIDKKEAARHLIHSAIRLVLKKEDPFAIHVLIQSADKILIDLAKKRGIDVTIDRKKDLPKDYRDADLIKPIQDIMLSNIKVISSASMNFVNLFQQV
jgi:bifunctional ADP-heptose synthase (sugar kinase/adenylyltransferase)